MKRFFAILCACFVAQASVAQDDSAKFTSQNNADFTKTIARKGIQLLDVRTSNEYADGHIPNSINIDVKGTDFDKKTSKLDKKRPVALYCRSGARSKVAAGKLARMGFDVYELESGMLNWNGKVEK